MTIKAYLIKMINMKIKNDEIIIEKKLEKTPAFYLKNNEKLLTQLQKYECNNINDDLNGEIVIDKITWTKILNEGLEEYTSNELNTIKQITNDLKNNEIIFYNCF